MTIKPGPKKTERILVATATIDENANILALVERVNALGPEIELLVIDDASKDGTLDTLKKLQVKHQNLHVVSRPFHLGLGGAHLYAWKYAVHNKFDYLVTMDADASHDPNDILRILEACKSSDFVIGSRYCPGGRCCYTGYRKVLSVSANILFRMVSGFRLSEFTNSLRGFRVSTLEKVIGRFSWSRNYSFFIESAMIFCFSKFEIREIGVVFYNRAKGKSKMPRLSILYALKSLVMLALARFRSVELNTDSLAHHCSSCGSAHLSQIFKGTILLPSHSDGMRCTSMNHRKQPNVDECLACGFRFATSDDGKETQKIEQLYANVVDKLYLENQEGRVKTFQLALRRISQYLPENGTLLEIGSYCGLFLNAARGYGLKVAGVEPSKWAAGIASTNFGHKIFPITLNQSGTYIDQQFQVVAMWDVLEHFVDPNGALSDVLRLLSDDGVFVFSTLDSDNWFAKMLGSRWPWLIPMHRSYFTVPVLRSLLKKNGFQLVDVKRYTHYTSIDYLIIKILAIFGMNDKIDMKWLPSRIRKWYIPISFGDIKLFVARKIENETIVLGQDALYKISV